MLRPCFWPDTSAASDVVIVVDLGPVNYRLGARQGGQVCGVRPVRLWLLAGARSPSGIHVGHIPAPIRPVHRPVRSSGHIVQADHDVLKLERGGGLGLDGQRQAEDLLGKDLVPARSAANRLMTFTRVSGRFMSAITKSGPELIGPALVNAYRGHQLRRHCSALTHGISVPRQQRPSGPV